MQAHEELVILSRRGDEEFKLGTLKIMKVSRVLVSRENFYFVQIPIL